MLSAGDLPTRRARSDLVVAERITARTDVLAGPSRPAWGDLRDARADTRPTGAGSAGTTTASPTHIERSTPSAPRQTGGPSSPDATLRPNGGAADASARDRRVELGAADRRRTLRAHRAKVLCRHVAQRRSTPGVATRPPPRGALSRLRAASVATARLPTPPRYAASVAALRPLAPRQPRHLLPGPARTRSSGIRSRPRSHLAARPAVVRSDAFILKGRLLRRLSSRRSWLAGLRAFRRGPVHDEIRSVQTSTPRS